MSDDTQRNEERCPVQQEYFDAWEKGETFPALPDLQINPTPQKVGLASRIVDTNMVELAKAVAWLKKRIG